MVKLIEQLQSPKLWSVLIGLLVSAGLLQFSDSQAGEVAGSLAGLFTALGMVVMAVLSQKGDNDANVEMARGVSRDVVARELPMLEVSEPAIDALWRRIGNQEERVKSLEQARGTSIETDIDGRYSELWLEFDELKQQVRETTMSEPRGTSIEPDTAEQLSLLWDELDRQKQRLGELEQARNVAANNVHIDRRAG